MESQTSVQAANSCIVGLVLGLMCVSPQVLGPEMLPFWCAIVLGVLLPHCQGFLNLGSVLGLSPAQPKDGELRGFLCLSGECCGTGGRAPTSVPMCPVPRQAHRVSLCSSGTCLLAGSAPRGTQLCAMMLRAPRETSREGQPNVAEPTFLVNEIFPTVEV